MMLKVFLFTTLSVVNFIHSSAECANGCSGHGRCTSYDMCVCNRNWMANDCSERVCQFGLAHVDTPKGDLDANGVVTNGNKLVVENSEVYPFGTTEQFPFGKDSDLQDVTDSAHYYMECSNKGTCDRTTGTCVCYDGYDGAACQRASCPGFPQSCSGHGVCRTIEQLANDEYGNIYKLWDRRSTMGCQCDKGYYGPDCSLRDCKYGIDPLYLDDSATIRYATYDVAVLTTSTSIDFDDGTPLKGQAYFSIRFYDVHGEEWLTDPIKAGASCEDVQTALYSLPNSVIPSGSIWCTLTSQSNLDGVSHWSLGNKTSADYIAAKLAFDTVPSDLHYATGSDDTFGRGRLIKYPLAFWQQRVRSSYGPYENDGDVLSGYVYRLKFLGNPGNLRQPEVEVYLDGKRPSISSAGGEVITAVWTDGQQGESKDYFADHCDGVTVQIGYSTVNGAPYFFLTGFTTAEKAALKTCLADADFDASNNVEVYNWDYGSKEYPHLIKLVKTHTTYTDGGYYVALYFDSLYSLDNLGTTGTFKLLNPFFSPDDYEFGLRFQEGDWHNVAYFSIDYTSKDNFEVYTTKGTLGLTSNSSQVVFGFGSQEIYVTNVTYDQYRTGISDTLHKFDGDISCEIGANNAYKNVYVNHCINRSDIFTILNFESPIVNPQHINLYQAKKLYTKSYTKSEYEEDWQAGPNTKAKVSVSNYLQRYGAGTYASHFEIHSIVTDLSTNWATTVTKEPHFDATNPAFHVYKFFPSTSSSYEYVAQCSNRGICDTTSGVCTCFPGYSHDDCSEQNSLHV